MELPSFPVPCSAPDVSDNGAMSRLSGGEAVAQLLADRGVNHVFGITSVHNLPIYDALSRTAGMTVVRMRHEQGAAHAADGYTRATGRLGVVLTSTGPGCVNAVAGLYEAGYGSSRVLMITGQIESAYLGKGKGFLHEFERQIDLLRSVTRRAESVRRAEDIGTLLAGLIDDICTGRPQPGAIEIPIDLQYRIADIDLPAARPPIRIVPDATAVDQAIRLLDAAERPLIWAGGGVVTADASDELIALAEQLGAPVITTIEGRGSIPEDHHLALGPRTERAALGSTVAEADVVLAVGTRFQNYSTRVWTLPIPGRLIHLDADAGVIGRNYSPTVAILGDAREGLAMMTKALAHRPGDHAYLARARAAVDADLAQSQHENGPDHTEIAAIIRRLLPHDGLVVRDSTVPGYLWGNRTLPILEPRTSLRPSSMAIGPGLGLAIGAAMGTGRPAVLIQGDGGLMLSIGELATLAEYRLPIVVCVFNDRGYGVLRSIESAMFDRHVGVDLHTPDFVQVARGMGISGEPVAGVAAFEDAFARALATDGPTLLDIDMASLAPMRFPLPAHYNTKK